MGRVITEKTVVEVLVTWPNTALEPTAIRAFSSAVVDDGLFRRGSAFGRGYHILWHL